eukprot:COSAG02_NODE_1311_length_13331_cov_1094.258035_2_plen_249_part_00
MTVTWADCDGRFSLPRFQEMTLARVREAMPPNTSSEEVRVLVVTALRSLQLYSLPSTRSLLELLRRINDGETPLLGGINKQMLVIDPINAFYGIDAMENSDALWMFKHVCQQIAQLDMAIFVAKAPLYTRREVASHREYLGESWTRLVKYRIVLWPEQSDSSSESQIQLQRRRPLAPELDTAAAAEIPGGCELAGGQDMHHKKFAAQRLLPPGSTDVYAHAITTAGIVDLETRSIDGTAVKGVRKSVR